LTVTYCSHHIITYRGWKSHFCLLYSDCRPASREIPSKINQCNVCKVQFTELQFCR